MKPNQTMYQVHVTDTDAGHEIPIGPAMDRAEALYKFAEATNLAILRGRIHGWKDAHVIKLSRQTQ
nr:hypothetical protein HUO10_003323 [Paraburkholderia busanensis]